MCAWGKGHGTPAAVPGRGVSGVSRIGSAGAMTGLKAALKSATVARDTTGAELAALRRDVRWGGGGALGVSDASLFLSPGRVVRFQCSARRCPPPSRGLRGGECVHKHTTCGAGPWHVAPSSGMDATMMLGAHLRTMSAAAPPTLLLSRWLHRYGQIRCSDSKTLHQRPWTCRQQPVDCSRGGRTTAPVPPEAQGRSLPSVESSQRFDIVSST